MFRQRSFTFALLAVSALTAAAIAQAATSGYWDRIQKIEEAARQRAKQQHKADPCHHEDPTPEIRFERVIDAHPGQTVTVTGMGHFGPNPEVVSASDHVKLVAKQATSSQLTAKLAVDKGALPEKVDLGVVGSLCPMEASSTAVEIVSDTRWNIAFTNGWKLAVDTHGREQGQYVAQVRWDGKGGPKVQKATLELRQPGELRASLTPTAEDDAAFRKRQQEAESYQPDPKVQARAEKAQADFQGCGQNKDMQKQIACMQSHQTELQAAMQALAKEQMKKIALPTPAKIGCLQLSLSFQPDGSAKAEGEMCSGGVDQLQGEGRVQVLP